MTGVSNPIVPVAFKKFKRGRFCTIAKVTYFVDDIHHSRPVLAVVWKQQRGTAQKISLPVVVVNAAKELGVEELFLRRDEPTRWMRKITLREFEHFSFYNKHDGEKYIDIAVMQPTPWREWLFAETEVEIASDDAGAGGERRGEGQQLSLFNFSAHDSSGGAA